MDKNKGNEEKGNAKDDKPKDEKKDKPKEKKDKPKEKKDKPKEKKDKPKEKKDKPKEKKTAKTDDRKYAKQGNFDDDLKQLLVAACFNVFETVLDRQDRYMGMAFETLLKGGKDDIGWALLKIRYAGKHADNKIFVIRGSWNVSNILSDVSLVLGTKKVRQNLDKVDKWLSDILDTGTKVDYITGHSLGGFCCEVLAAKYGITGASFAAPGPYYLKKKYNYVDTWHKDPPTFMAFYNEADPVVTTKLPGHEDPLTAHIVPLTSMGTWKKDPHLLGGYIKKAGGHLDQRKIEKYFKNNKDDLKKKNKDDYERTAREDDKRAFLEYLVKTKEFDKLFESWMEKKKNTGELQISFEDHAEKHAEYVKEKGTNVKSDHLLGINQTHNRGMEEAVLKENRKLEKKKLKEAKEYGKKEKKDKSESDK